MAPALKVQREVFVVCSFVFAMAQLIVVSFWFIMMASTLGI